MSVENFKPEFEAASQTPLVLLESALRAQIESTGYAGPSAVLDAITGENPLPSAGVSPHEFQLVLRAYASEIDLDGEPAVTGFITELARDATAQFEEPVTPEADMTPTARRLESQISSFIAENNSLAHVEIAGEIDIRQLLEIYNAHNLLALAHEFAEVSDQWLDVSQLDMLGRYRVVIHTLLARMTELQYLRQAETNPSAQVREPKDGARTWGADIHPYGHRKQGCIDSREYRDFDADREDEVPAWVTVDGVRVQVAKVTRLEESSS